MNRGLVNVHEGESWGVTLGASSSWPLRTFQNRTLLGLGGNWPLRRARACCDCPVPELGLAPELEPTGLYELGYDELMLVPLGVGAGMWRAGLGWAGRNSGPVNNWREWPPKSAKAVYFTLNTGLANHGGRLGARLAAVHFGPRPASDLARGLNVKARLRTFASAHSVVSSQPVRRPSPCV